MFSKTFNTIFKISNSNDIDILNEISNGLGEYASCSFNESNIVIKNKRGQKMLSIITAIEIKSTESNDTNLFYNLIPQEQEYPRFPKLHVA